MGLGKPGFVRLCLGAPQVTAKRPVFWALVLETFQERCKRQVGTMGRTRGLGTGCFEAFRTWRRGFVGEPPVGSYRTIRNVLQRHGGSYCVLQLRF